MHAGSINSFRIFHNLYIKIRISADFLTNRNSSVRIRVMLKKLKEKGYALGACALLVANGAFGYIHAANDKEEEDRQIAYEQLYRSMRLEISSRPVEYGSQVTAEDLVVYSSHDYTLVSDFDPDKPGTYTVACTLQGSEDIYGETAEKTIEKTATVVDTQAPVITFNEDSVSISKGTDFDVLSNIASVADPIDGELTEGEGNGTYTVTSNLDQNTDGTYQVTVTARDINGNTSEKTYEVQVYTPKPKVVTTYSVSADTSGNYSAILSYLTGSLGLNKAAASGVLANIYYESKFNPTAGSSYYGLCQWGGGRRSNLASYTASLGLSADSLEGQLAYMAYELNGSYSGVLASLRSVEDSAAGAEAAAAIFCRGYEGASAGGRGALAASYYAS